MKRILAVLTLATVGVLAMAVPASANVHRVSHGDTLWSITVARYGDGHCWSAIARLNHINDAHRLHAGQAIRLPRELWCAG